MLTSSMAALMMSKTKRTKEKTMAFADVAQAIIEAIETADADKRMALQTEVAGWREEFPRSWTVLPRTWRELLEKVEEAAAVGTLS